MAPIIVVTGGASVPLLPPLAPDLPATMGILKIGFIIVLAVIAAYALWRGMDAMRTNKSVIEVALNGVAALLAVAALWQLAGALLAGTSSLPKVIVDIVERGVELVGADLSSAIKSLK